MVLVDLDVFLEPEVYVWESSTCDPLNIYSVLVLILEERLERPSPLLSMLYFLLNVVVWVNLTV